VKLIGGELAKLAAAEGALHGDRAEMRALDAADESALAFEELTGFFAARAARDEGIPTIGALPAGGLAAGHFEPLAAVQGSGQDVFQLFGAQLTQDPDAELTYQVADRSLQLLAQLPVRGDQLQAAIDARHGADGDEASAGSGREALDQCGAGNCIVALGGRRVGVGLGQALAGGAVADEYCWTAARLALPNEAAVEAQLVRRGNTDTQNRGLAVDGDTPGANPILHLATRSEAGAGQDLLQALAVGVGIGCGAASRAATAGAAAPVAIDVSFASIKVASTTAAPVGARGIAVWSVRVGPAATAVATLSTWAVAPASYIAAWGIGAVAPAN